MTCQKRETFVKKKQTNKQINKQTKQNKTQKTKKQTKKTTKQNKQTNFVYFGSSDFVHFRLSTLKSSAIHKMTYCANSA